MVKVRRRVNVIKAQIERCPWWLIFIFAVLLLFGAGFGCGYYCGANVYDHSIGDGAAQRQLDQAQENQHAITDRAEDAAQRAGDIEDGIGRGQEAVNRAEESAGRIDSGLQEAGNIIEDCQRILESVRQRGKAD